MNDPATNDPALNSAALNSAATHDEHPRRRDDMPDETDIRARVRRLARGKAGTALVGALVGALLATGVMAWRAGELPLVPHNVCWNALSSDDLDGLFSDEGDIRAQEMPLDHALGADETSATQCGIQRWQDDELKWEVTAEVKELDRYHGKDGREWPEEFLSSAMVPLGGEVTGMVSPARAWVALPATCQGGRKDDPPTVVSLSSGRPDTRQENPREARSYRAALASAVVHLANGVMDEHGCSGRYADPDTEKLAPLAPYKTPKGDADLCGLKGVRLPKRARSSVGYSHGMRATSTREGVVHSCEVGREPDSDGLRLTTIEDPGLGHAVEPLAREGTERLKGDGYGSVSGDLAVYTVPCQTGQVVFTAQARASLSGRSPAVSVLPSYVRAQAKRIGCGDVKVEGAKRAERSGSR
ncbi:hypothetical protein OG533_10710 [Streptomyces sp. NBC_01186]|uniref:hypothetical protein n=1 Tax=Streptomyces sp. NBC_01186 TaxID=2903765 RepID=UPI002E0E199C|nr:hypothetical protein OG533_10710 [Streptomyces sp. NBC_01186]